MLSPVTNLRFFASCFMLMALVLPARAQKNEPPSGQFGVGIYAATGAPSGLEGTYAISENMQVGTLFSLGLSSGGGESSTTFLLAPYFRYLFSSAVSPFVQGGLSIISSGGSTNAGIFMGGGLAYYLSRRLGIHADVDIIDVTFSNPSILAFGWSNVRIGLDWFFSQNR